MDIRRAGADDAAAIADVLYAAFAEYQAIYTPGGFAATTPPADRIRERLPEGPVWVAVENEAIVGTVAAVHKGEGMYVRSMAILPTARGQGIGALLLSEIEHAAREAGAHYLYLSTTPFLTRAIRLYERWGFERSADGPTDLFGTPIFKMIKPLAPKIG